FVVRGSLDEEHKHRVKSDKLSQDNEKLAEKEKKAREEADRRRERAEELALRIRFEHFYSRATDDSSLTLAGTAQLLPEAAGLKNSALLESMRLHLESWAPEVHHLRWIGPAGGSSGKVALSADGKLALTGGSHSKIARLWETATGKPL